ncbi:tyrosyl-DNA phosphodiesterase glaikit [Lycorma delicatula]|uniref:tyrosyl-DNA phosphodiesterase glaikit n=1 Tax=Lycorma delicatula TaxID=130591 RepID=UPI003F50FD80
MDKKRDNGSPQTANGSSSVCLHGEDCYRQNPKHFEEYSHPHLEDLISKMSEDEIKYPPGYKQKISKRILDLQIGFQRNIKKYGVAVKNDNLPSNENRSTKTNKSNHSNSSVSSSLASVATVSHSRGESSSKNNTQAQNYRCVVMDRVKNNIDGKWNDAAPYYFFLSAISDSKETHTERLTVHFPELLDPKLGDLKASLQFTFMVEIGWLLAQYHIMGHKGKPMTLVYGEGDDDMARCPPHVTPLLIKCPSPFGTHHTKMSIMLYTDNSLRVIVCTGNLVESDWDNRTQGVWISPRCPPLKEGVDTGSGDSLTHFKKDLLQYISSYKQPGLQEWVGHIRRTDFSEIRVFFVASIPGTYKELENDYWSQGKIMYILKRHATIKPSSAARDWQIITQCSSIGSLGPQPNSWLTGQIMTTFSAGQGLNFPSTSINVIYPSFEDVAASHDGLLGGACLPYSRKTHQKQLWLHNYLNEWKSDKRYRTKAMPHIKTYCRVSPDYKNLSWFLLTSANLSKAAWGNSKTPGKNYVMSYEAGVLFLPKFLVNKDTLPIHNDTAEGVPVFPMPYDLPLTPYKKSDIPWFFENFC